MPPRSQTLPTGALKIQNLLEHLNSSPSLKLTGIKALRLTLASQNDHFGARHFINDNLPKIRWSNPDLEIQVHRERKSASEKWKAEMELESTSGEVQKFDINDKLSTEILKELMDTAGGDPWKKHVEDCAESGQPLFSEESLKKKRGNSFFAEESLKTRPKHITNSSKNLPSLAEFLAKNPEKKAGHVRKEPAGKKVKVKTTPTEKVPSTS